MLDNLIRDVGARWGLGGQAQSLVQMLVAYMTNPSTGGLSGFLDRFRNAGMSAMVEGWIGNPDSPAALSADQVHSVLGAGPGFISDAASRLGLNADKVTAAVAAILPTLVARMTPGGHIPAHAPGEFAAMARQGDALLQSSANAAYGSAASAAQASGGMGKWIPWILGALIVIFGLSYCNRQDDRAVTTDTAAPNSNVNTPPPAATVTPEPAPAPIVPALDANTLGDTPTPSSTDSVPAVPMGTDASSNQGSLSTTTDTLAGATVGVPLAADFQAPEGSAVLDEMYNGMPLLRVFFDTGKTDVASDFSSKSADLVAFLKANPDVKAVISGFNDPTGNAQRNAELSKQRAQAVKTALESAGVPAEQALMEKPAETTDTGASHAASRRVDVVLRR